MALQHDNGPLEHDKPQFTDIPACGDWLPELSLPLCCPGCGIVLRAAQVAANLYVCSCGHHFPIYADAWLSLLADAGSWVECWADLAPRDVPEWQRPRPYSSTLAEGLARGLNEAVRSGRCTIGGRQVWLAVFEFRFVGGTLGSVAGERLARTLESATNQRLPVLVVTSSGGARMQEGVDALLQMAKINGALAALHDAGVPYLSVLSYPTYGGAAASFALLADVNIAEPGASLGFTGPRVIEQATQEHLPADFQTAEFQLRHGQVDMIVPRTALRSTLARLLDLLR